MLRVVLLSRTVLNSAKSRQCSVTLPALGFRNFSCGFSSPQCSNSQCRTLLSPVIISYPTNKSGYGARCLSSTLVALNASDSTLNTPVVDSGGVLAEVLAEPTFQSLGLAHWYPSGWIQYLIEQIYLNLDIPWWGAIMITTAFIRVLMFPIVVKSQKNMLGLNKVMPEHQKLQMERMRPHLSEAQRSRAKAELKRFEAKHGINPIFNYLPFICQAGVFTSMFFAIRGMANCPVASMQDGGALWFVDLLACDPFYLLPIATSASVFLHIKFGSDGLDVSTMQKNIKRVILLLPIISFPFMCQFPAALNVYWLTTNLVSISQARLLKFGPIRKQLGLGEMIKWPEDQLPMTSLNNFVQDGAPISAKPARQNAYQIGAIDFKTKEMEWKRRIEKQKAQAKN